MISTNEILNSDIFDYKVIPVADNIKNALQGEGEKKVLIACSDQQTKELEDFLEKIFQAVHIIIEKDAWVLPIPEGQVFWLNALVREFAIQKVLLFGIKPEAASLSFEAPLYQPVELSGVTYLLADEISEIHSRQELKRQLWSGLQRVFPGSSKK